jgi:nickel/cobalt transporter (NiCoT) family protein
VNLWQVIRPSSAQAAGARPIVGQPFLLGMILAAGFETASQLSALMLAGRTNPWLFGASFSGGMALVDGLDGYLAASTLKLAASGESNAKAASRLLGVLVVLFAFGLGGAELIGYEINQFALPLGLALFAIVIAIRVWARTASVVAIRPSASHTLTRSAIRIGRF